MVSRIAACAVALAIGLGGVTTVTPAVAMPASLAKTGGEAQPRSDIQPQTVQDRRHLRGNRRHLRGERRHYRQHRRAQRAHRHFRRHHARPHYRHHRRNYARRHYARPYYVPPRAYVRPYYARPYVRRAPAVGLSTAHVTWCHQRYRSYRAWDNTYQPYNGPRRQCWSPYV